MLQRKEPLIRFGVGRAGELALVGPVGHTGSLGHNTNVMGDEQIVVGDADLAPLLIVGSPTAGVLPAAARQEPRPSINSRR